MVTLQYVAQVCLGLVILNVWLFRANRATPYRGGDALNMKSEFETYGLPTWVFYGVGFAKITLASALLIGLWFPELTKPAAFGLGALMVAAILMHLKVRDPLRKSAPALLMLLLSLGTWVAA